MKQQSQPSFKTLLRDERGAVAIIMTIMLPVIVGFMTLAVDAAYTYTTHNQLQVAADAAALAGVQSVGSYTGVSSTPCTSNPSTPSLGSTLCAAAQKFGGGTYNQPYGAGNTTILATGASACPGATSCITVGVWAATVPGGNGTFTPLSNGAAPNAVKVTTQMTAANKNALSLFYTSMLGIIAKTAGFKNISLTATAVAAYTSTNAEGGSLTTPAHLIIAIDMSSSFSNNILNAILAVKDCAKYFAQQNNSNSNFGVTLFTGNSPQTGWAPQGWTSTDNSTYCSGNACTTPYMGLTSATSSNFLTNADNQISNINNVENQGLYQHSGSNVAAGMQSTMNQFSGSGISGTTEMIIVTDGVPNCTSTYDNNPSKFGTSTTANQNCPAGQVNNGNGKSETTAQTNAGDVQLLTDAQNLATTAGADGITVSTLYYSGESGQGNGNTVDPNSPTHQTYAQELQSLTTNANTALLAMNPKGVKGQFFNEPDPTLLNSDLGKVCSAAASGNANGYPRLVQ